jgi:aspartyl protease family protein
MSMLLQQQLLTNLQAKMNNPWDPNETDKNQRPTPNKRHRNRLILLAIIVVIVVFGYWYSDQVPGTSENDDKVARFIALAALLILVSAGFAFRRISFNKATKYAGTWLVIVGILSLGYAFRSELKMAGDRVLGELLPGYNIASAPQVVEISASNNGHYMIDSLVNGRPLRFMVDTGASVVVLSPGDAERLGFKLDTLSFDRPMRTANGLVQGASIKIRRITIGTIEMYDVPAIVNGAKLSHSLLGMSYLERLHSFEIRDARLTLRGAAN